MAANILEEHFIPSNIDTEEEAMNFLRNEIPLFTEDDSFEFIPIHDYAYLISEPWKYEEFIPLRELDI